MVYFIKNWLLDIETRLLAWLLSRLESRHGAGADRNERSIVNASRFLIERLKK